MRHKKLKQNWIWLFIGAVVIVMIGLVSWGSYQVTHHPRPQQMQQQKQPPKDIQQPAENSKETKPEHYQAEGASTSQSATDNQVSNRQWTNQEALNFLQRVNDTSSEGHRLVGEDVANYMVSDSVAHLFPGNSIFILENNKSGAGDGGVLLTNNPQQKTVTMVIGSGAGSTPELKAIINSTTYKVMSTSEIDTDKDIFTYFGVKNPVGSSDSDNNSNSDSNYSSNNDQNDNQESVNNDSSYNTNTSNQNN